jgi:predicted dehydrogenase
MFRLAMLGMWHTHADGLVRQVVAHPDEFTLVGFHDADAEVVAARRKTWGTQVPSFRVFDTPEALLRQPLDGVVVEGRVHQNLRLARLALDSGRPVLLEKPAGDNLDEFRRLIDLAQRKHLRVQMLYLFRYMSAVQELLRRVRQGELGTLYEFRARLPKDLATYRRFVEELQPYRGGMFFEMAGHVLDVMVAVLGRPREIKACLAHHHAEGPASYVDNGVAVFGCDHAWGILEVPALEVAPHSRRVEVYGTRGACVIPHLGSGHLANKDIQPIEVYRAGQDDWQRQDLPAATLQLPDLREFAACVRGQKDPDFSTEHDLIVQEALLQACGMTGPAAPK